MIEELKALLDTIAGVPDLALYALAGFGIYKLVIYLSLTGSVAYTIRFLAIKYFEYRTNELKVQEYVQIDGIRVRKDQAREILSLCAIRAKLTPDGYQTQDELKRFKELVEYIDKYTLPTTKSTTIL